MPGVNLNRRQRMLLELLRQAGSARIGDLADRFAVSTETVRRDLARLAETGEIVKLHGRVQLSATAGEAPFEQRMQVHAAAKRAIARHVAATIDDGDSVMMDTGTTTSMLARVLLGKRRLTIVTNSSDVARTLATVNDNKVYMAGGELHGDNGAAFGRSAIEFIRQFRVRHAIISIGAIDAVSGAMDYRLAEAEFARNVLARGERRLIITDHTKFNRPALVTVCGFDDFDALVCDRPPPADLAHALAEAGVRTTVAES